MAELSEVMALRTQNYEQQQREAAQLRAQVMKLQQCCQAVRQGVCTGLLAPVMAPWDPYLLLPALTPWSSEAQGPSLCQSQCWRRHQRAPHPVPSSQVGGRAQRETQGVPGNRPRDSPRSLALFHVASFLKSCQRLIDELGKILPEAGCARERGGLG